MSEKEAGHVSCFIHVIFWMCTCNFVLSSNSLQQFYAFLYVHVSLQSECSREIGGERTSKIRLFQSETDSKAFLMLWYVLILLQLVSNIISSSTLAHTHKHTNTCTESHKNQIIANFHIIGRFCNKKNYLLIAIECQQQIVITNRFY